MAINYWVYPRCLDCKAVLSIPQGPPRLEAGRGRFWWCEQCQSWTEDKRMEYPIWVGPVPNDAERLEWFNMLNLSQRQELPESK